LKKPVSPNIIIGKGKEEKKMGTSQAVLTKNISLWEDPGMKKEDLLGTKKEILEALSKVLNGEDQCPLFDLVLYTGGRGSTGPFVNKIFILGRREAILCNPQKITGRIASKNGLKKKGVWIGGVWIGSDSFRRPKIEDFI